MIKIRRLLSHIMSCLRNVRVIINLLTKLHHSGKHFYAVPKKRPPFYFFNNSVKQ